MATNKMQLVSEYLTVQNAFIAFVTFLLYIVALYVYRAYFDRLSHVPGPKVAAATLWYEFYFDVIKKGRYTWEIKKMHEKYGKHAPQAVI